MSALEMRDKSHNLANPRMTSTPKTVSLIQFIFSVSGTLYVIAFPKFAPSQGLGLSNAYPSQQSHVQEESLLFTRLHAEQYPLSFPTFLRLFLDRGFFDLSHERSYYAHYIGILTDRISRCAYQYLQCLCALQTS